MKASVKCPLHDFEVVNLFARIADQYFSPIEARDLPAEHARSIAKWRTQYTLEEFERCATFVANGGRHRKRDHFDSSWIACTDFKVAMAESRDWEASGAEIVESSKFTPWDPHFVNGRYR